jgi:hypothetical protein
MKRFYLLSLFLVVAVVAAPAFAAGPSATKAVTAEAEGISTLFVTVSSAGEEVFAVTISGANLDDIRAPKGWVGVASGNHVVFRTGANPVKSGNSLAFKLLTTEPSASLTVSFQGKDDPIGQPINL